MLRLSSKVAVDRFGLLKHRCVNSHALTDVTKSRSSPWGRAARLARRIRRESAPNPAVVQTSMRLDTRAGCAIAISWPIMPPIDRRWPEREQRDVIRFLRDENRVLKAHWPAVVAADFFTTEVWTARGLVTYYTLFVIELASRRVHVVG